MPVATSASAISRLEPHCGVQQLSPSLPKLPQLHSQSQPRPRQPRIRNTFVFVPKSVWASLVVIQTV
eukprot:364541-Chlamydomonas_euryale.AAC.1